MTLYRKTRGRCSCGYEYAGDSRRRICPECGATRVPKRRPKHLKALELGYDDYLVRNGGVERCGICGAPPKKKALHRDHDHRTGKPRALLCFPCNSALRPYMTRGWLLSAADYLGRFEGEEAA